MAVSWRRPSAFSTDNEFSLSQTDEIRIKSTPISADSRRSTQLSKEKKKQTIWIVYFIGFMVRCSLYKVVSVLSVELQMFTWFTALSLQEDMHLLNYLYNP